jgi:hypothetical protein
MAVCKVANCGRGRARKATIPPTKDYQEVRSAGFGFLNGSLLSNYLEDLRSQKGAVAGRMLDDVLIRSIVALIFSQSYLLHTSEYGKGEDQS